MRHVFGTGEGGRCTGLRGSMSHGGQHIRRSRRDARGSAAAHFGRCQVRAAHLWRERSRRNVGVLRVRCAVREVGICDSADAADAGAERQCAGRRAQCRADWRNHAQRHLLDYATAPGSGGSGRGCEVLSGREGEIVMLAFRLPKITLWRVLTCLIFVTGIYATYARFLLGFRASTNLTDTMPWGLWVGLGTLCGVGLSAGGFAIAAAVYILGFERYRPVLRAAILISFLGYLTVVIGMLYEIGLPWRLWHPLVMWNRRSVLFEVAWCVMLYTTVLTLEFSPALMEKLPWKAARRFYLAWHHRLLIALVLVGVLLSSLHQSFLGGLYLLAKGKLDPLWYSTYLPTLFY